MENIVFYVHRTGLLSYFVNPICEFLKDKYKITILHIDKKNHYSYAPSCSPLYSTIDLSDKSLTEIQQLLTALRPKAFVSLGFISIYELLMLRVCKGLGIKTIYLEHGIYSKETSSLPLGKLLHKFRTTVSKNLFFLRLYYQFVRNSKDAKNERFVFWHCFRKKEYFYSKFDKALFFAEYGSHQISNLFHYEKQDIDYICYPLAKTTAEYLEYKKIAGLPLCKDKKATLIHQPFILDGLAQWSYEEERDYFEKLAKKLRNEGYSFSIQLHPRSDAQMYRNLYAKTGIEILSGMQRMDFKKYSLVLGYYSTALLYPLFFHIPIQIIDYPNVAKAEDSIFYPISCKLPIRDMGKFYAQYDAFGKGLLGVGDCSFENIAQVLERNI